MRAALMSMIPRETARGERRRMRKVKSYSGVWKFERIMHTIGNWRLPIAATMAQIGWFVGTLIFDIAVLKRIPPLCYTENVLVEYLVIPVFVTWFMSKKTFEGKRPYSYLRSVILYFMRPRLTYAGKKVVYGKEKVEENITIVRCDLYVPDKVPG